MRGAGTSFRDFAKVNSAVVYVVLGWRILIKSLFVSGIYLVGRYNLDLPRQCR